MITSQPLIESKNEIQNLDILKIENDKNSMHIIKQILKQSIIKDSLKRISALKILKSNFIFFNS